MAQEYMYICTELSPSNDDNSAHCKHWKLVPSDEFFSDNGDDDLYGTLFFIVFPIFLLVVFLKLLHS